MVVGEGGWYDCLTAWESDRLRSSGVSKNGGVREIGILLSFRFLRGKTGATNLVYPSSVSQDGRVTLQRADV